MKYRKWEILLCVFIMVSFAAGCSGDKKGTVTGTKYYNPKEPETENTENSKETEQVEAVFSADMYMVVSNDMSAEQLILKQMASGKQYLFSYSLTTRFLDKYGNPATAALFDSGRIITVGEKDSQGRLKKVQISDKVWEYSQVVRYEIDEERKIFKIADTKYTFGEELLVVSDENKMELAELGESDVLRVIGMNREILSISVTTGHGIISLKNTGVFEGSFIQVGKKIFAEITEDLSLEVPEGTYTVTVANKGYGGSKEITVERASEIVIDLDELKGEGPKQGTIRFYISDGEGNTVDAALKIDGKTVSYEDALELDYGIHTIRVSADGFELYAKKLFVNSEQAEINIALSKEKTVQESTSQVSSSDETKETSEDTANTADNEAEQEMSDYLSTLTELLGNLYN